MATVSAKAETALVAQAVGGDLDALTELLEQHGPAVRQIIRGRIPARYRALVNENDLMQETYAEAFLDIGRFEPDGDGAFRSWLLQIAQHNLVDAIRKLRAEKRGGERCRLNESREQEDNWLSLIHQLGDPGTTPSAGARRRELRGTLQRALRQLPVVYRDVILLYDLQDRTAAEVADELGCSRGCVYMRRRRALDMLQQVLKRFSDYQ